MSIKRGRPRPQSTIDLDANVFSLLIREGPMSREDLSVSCVVNTHVLYRSLCRLRTAGRVITHRTGKRHLWIANTHG